MSREKVIKGMECCIPMTLRKGLADCGNCPYDRKITIDGGITECCHDLMTDALALLNAQTPRLLTAEDFHGNPDLDDGGGLPCWKEARKETRRSGWAVICYGKWLADTESGAARYWTRKPTEEQRRDEPWQG